ncbi:hypothetical protein [Absidia glauca]|uniref:Uncharacterized protein n=1 Tax=Absidia glauca TaxID=4829 RepID=A0A168LBI6_ABSGL|nr:hypothetical protein [Absidia glauca]
MTTTFKVLKHEVIELQQVLRQWKHIEPEGLALIKLCQLLLEDDSHLTKLTAIDKTKDISLIFRDLTISTRNFIQRDQEGQDLWGNMLWKTRRDLLISQYRLTWQSALFDQLDPLMKKALNRPFPFYNEIEHYKDDMMIKEKDVKNTTLGGEDEASYRYYMSLFDQAKLPNMWSTFMKKYQEQFGKWDAITQECLMYLLCTDGQDMNIYSYIAVTREYGFPLDMEKLPLMMLSPPPVPSEQARVETAKMIMDLVTYFSSKEMRDHLLALYTWFKGFNKRDSAAMQDRANEWANAILDSRTKNAAEWTDQDELADRVDLARRTISLFYQRYMVMWRMGQFARDLFTDVDFPGKARILEMKEHVLPLDIANYHVVIRGDPAKWEAKRPKVYNFMDQVVKQA